MSRRPTLVGVVKMYVDPEFGSTFEEGLEGIDDTDISAIWESVNSEMTGLEPEEGVLFFYKVLANEWGEVDYLYINTELERLAKLALEICPTTSEKDKVLLSLSYW